MPLIRAVRYDDIYRMEEIKSLSFHIIFEFIEIIIRPARAKRGARS